MILYRGLSTAEVATQLETPQKDVLQRRKMANTVSYFILKLEACPFRILICPIFTIFFIPYFNNVNKKN